MSGNSGAWGLAMWRDGYSAVSQQVQEQGISIEGGDAIIPYLPTVPLGCLTLPPEGLGVPPVRNGDVAFAQRDGVVQFADYYEPRLLTFQVDIPNVGCPGCDPAAPDETFLLLNGTAPGRARTMDTPSIKITGDIDLRIEAALDDWTPGAASSLISKSTTSGGFISYRFTVLTSGMLRLAWSEDGSAVLSADSTAAPTVADGDPLWVRATMDVNNGAAGRTITFYTSTDGLTWTILGAAVVQAGVTSIFDPAGTTTASIIIGSRDSGTLDRMSGKVYAAEIYRGIDGTLVASPDFTEEGVGTTIFDDSEGNVWQIFAPAVISSTPGAVPLSARQAVSRLTQEWSRNCTGATLVIFSDCHDPDATMEERVYKGPYLVRGRPRVAEVNWRRSDIGGASVLLRFDAEDARLILVNTIPGAFWDSEQTQTLDADEQNLAPDADLSGLTMTVNGATVTDTYRTSGGPLSGDGGPYFERLVTAVPASSPHAMALSGTGTSGIPVDPADVLSVGWWARKDNPTGGIPQTRLDWTWYNAGGAVISSHTGVAHTATADWVRYTEENIIAPALAEFVQFRLSWTGIPGSPGYTLDFAQAWVNEGATVTEPETVEIVGTLCVYPVITLFPHLTAPIVVTYGDHEFTYNEDVPVGTVIEIDTRWGRAADGFTDVTQNLDGDFTSPLEPGIHPVMMQSGDITDTGFVNIQWENAVVSG